MMRVTPKMSDKPAPTKNRLDAAASPLSAWNRRASRLMGRGSRSVAVAVVPAKAGTHDHRLWNMSPQHKHVYARLRRAIRRTTSQRADWSDNRDQFIAAAGRSFFTSSSEGMTLAPSTYLKSDIVPLPSLSAILPT